MKVYTPKDIAGKLSKLFIRSPLTPLLGAFLLILGYLSLVLMPREENPQMVVSGSTVIIALPGATAKEIKKVIVEPAERKLKEIKGVKPVNGEILVGFQGQRQLHQRPYLQQSVCQHPGTPCQWFFLS